MYHDHTQGYSGGDALQDVFWIILLLVAGLMIFRWYLRSLARAWYQEKHSSQLEHIRQIEKGPHGKSSE